MAGPQDASISADGFRFYRWDDGDNDPTDVLSVTSIRKLCGEPFTLVNWQLANVIDVAMGTQKRPAIGKKGQVLKGKFTNVPTQWPSEFVQRYLDASVMRDDLDDDDGVMTTWADKEKLETLRKWLRAQADEPRNMAARRGTIVHAAIEYNIKTDQVERDWVESEFANLSKRDRDRATEGVTFEDIDFIRDSVRWYWDMRDKVPFVIIAREPQVWNLTAGYAGSADALVWVLPKVHPQSLPKPDQITQALIEEVGGYTVLLDWKTSKGVYTDHVVQVHAYLGAEFVGSNGVKDERLTEILRATMKGGLVHIRPEGWDISYVDFREDVMYAFLGSCAFARFLGRFPEPQALFTSTINSKEIA